MSTTKSTKLQGFQMGNGLFERTIGATLLDVRLTRRLVAECLGLVGATPQTMTEEELAMILPELERRLRLLADANRVARALARIRKLLLA